jgi:outer membrane receptor for ferrienterochelin and colicins
MLAKHSVLTGINYFNYSNPIDNNNDNFTDLTLQDLCIPKWNINRKSNKLFSMAGRFFTKTVGGEMQWEKKHRGVELKYMAKALYQTLGIIGRI